MSERDEAAARPPRVYVPDLAERLAGSEEDAREILLRKEERDHVRSRRLGDGDEVVAIDGKGLRAPGVLARRGTAVELAVSPSKKISGAPRPVPGEEPHPGEPRNRVVVGLACAEPARVEWAIEKGTECGAAGFVLLACERSQKSHVAALSSPARLARLARIAVEATKQCDRTLVPFVEGPKSTGDFLGRVRGEELFVASPGGAALPAPTLPRAAIVVIGPEGGFAPPEISSFAEKSPVFFSLGPRILRLETAVVVALARLVDPG